MMKNESKQQLIVFWVLWVAFINGVCLSYYFLSRSSSPTSSFPANSPIWLLGLVPVVISGIIRWMVLPRVQSPQAALPPFIMGLAFAEAACFLGLFVFRSHRQELLVFSLLGMLQMMPMFANRFYHEDPPTS